MKGSLLHPIVKEWLHYRCSGALEQLGHNMLQNALGCVCWKVQNGGLQRDASRLSVCLLLPGHQARAECVQDLVRFVRVYPLHKEAQTAQQQTRLNTVIRKGTTTI